MKDGEKNSIVFIFIYLFINLFINIYFFFQYIFLCIALSDLNDSPDSTSTGNFTIDHYIYLLIYFNSIVFILFFFL